VNRRPITVAQTLRARRRAFGATGWRTAPTAVDYTQFTDAELQTARSEVLEALQAENATDEDATRADAIATEIERRNTVTTATNERRRRLADTTVVERWRQDTGNTQAQRRGQHQDDPPPPTGDHIVPTDWRDQLATGAAGYRDRGMTGTSEILRLPNATDLRALVTTVTLPHQPQRLPGIVHPPDQILKVADLVDQQTATSGSVEWVVETSTAPPAAEVAEGLAKPEAAMTFTVASAALATIAVWIPLTRQSAEDDAQLTGYIQGRLSFAVEKRIDTQVLNGNGTAPNMRGILNTVGIQEQDSDLGMLIAIRKAITKTQVSGYNPSGVVMHPVDWEGVELTQDSTTGTFLFTKDPSSLAAPRIWGLPVVPTVGIAAGTALVGAFKEGATLWRKPGVRILMSDSHVDNFIKNILILLAETRAQLAVYAPAAFVKVYNVP
jgi:HK97 family phage major capsid protein